MSPFVFGLLIMYLCVSTYFFIRCTYRLIMAAVKDTIIGWNLMIPGYYTSFIIMLLLLVFYCLLWPIFLQSIIYIIYEIESNKDKR